MQKNSVVLATFVTRTTIVRVDDLNFYPGDTSAARTVRLFFFSLATCESGGYFAKYLVRSFTAS
jgi:hypothetical protein